MKSMKRKLSEPALESSFSGKNVLKSSVSHKRHSMTKFSHQTNDSKTKSTAPKIPKIKLKVPSKRKTLGTSSMKKEKLLKQKRKRNSAPGCSTEPNLGRMKDKRNPDKKRKKENNYDVTVDSFTESIPSVTSLLNGSSGEESAGTGSEGRHDNSFSVFSVKQEPIEVLQYKIINQAMERDPDSAPSKASKNFNVDRPPNKRQPRKVKRVDKARKMISTARKSQQQSTWSTNETLFSEPQQSSIAGGGSFDFDTCSDVELYQEIMSVTSFAGTLRNFALNQRLMNYVIEEYKNKSCVKNSEVRRKMFGEMFGSVLFYKKHLKDRTEV